MPIVKNDKIGIGGGDGCKDEIIKKFIIQNIK